MEKKSPPRRSDVPGSGMLTLVVGYLAVLFTLDAGKDALAVLDGRGPKGPLGFLTDAIPWWGVWLPLLILGLSLAQRVAPDRLGWLRSVVANVGLSVLLVFTHVFLVSLVFDVMSGPDDGLAVLRRMRRLGTIFLMPELLTVWGAVALLYAYAFGSRLQADELQPVPSDSTGRIMVRQDESIRFVRVERVLRLEAAGNYVKVVADDGVFTVRSPLKDLLGRLDPSTFVRVHRSHGVNLDRVVEIQPWFGGDYVVVMDNDEEVRLSRSYRDEVMRAVR